MENRGLRVLLPPPRAVATKAAKWRVVLGAMIGAMVGFVVAKWGMEGTALRGAEVPRL